MSTTTTQADTSFTDKNKNNPNFVDLKKLTRIISAETKPQQRSSLITSSVPLQRSSSDGQTKTKNTLMSTPRRFSYNSEHINLLAKSLHLIADSYKDVVVNLPLKENISLLHEEDIHDDNIKQPENENLSSLQQGYKRNSSNTLSSLKSCMKKTCNDTSDDDNNSIGKDSIDDLGLVNFKPVVSFDTVPLGSLSAANIDDNIIAPEDYYTEEEWYDNETDEPYQDTYVGYRGKNVNPQQYSSSSFQNVTSSSGDLIKGLQKLKILEGYSTTPYINNSALIINKKHPQFDQFERDIKRKKTTILKQRKYRLKTITNTNPSIDKRFRHGTNAASIDSTDVRARTLRKINKEIGWNNQGRSILVHISGRRHSWVALDYAISNIVNNGDCLIVTCNLPKENMAERMTRRKDRVNRKIKLQKLKSKLGSDVESSSTSSSGDDDDDADRRSGYCSSDDEDELYDRNETHWKNGYTYNEVEEALNDILKYIHLILPFDKIIKLTCEITVDNTKDSLINAYNCYLPKLIVTTTKKWQHHEHIGDESSKLLADVLTSYFPIPIVVIPVKKSDLFENYIKERLLVTTNVHISTKEKQEKLAELNKEFLTVKRPALPFMMIFKNKHHQIDNSSKLNNELHLEEFKTTNATEGDISASDQLSLILETYKKNLDIGLTKLDEKYPNYTDGKKSIETTDLIADQSAKYNKDFNNIKSNTEVDSTLDSLKNVLSQGENFSSKKIVTPKIVINKPNDVSSKPPVNRTIKLQPAKSPKDKLNPVTSNNELRRYQTLSVGDVLKNGFEESSESNGLKRIKTSTSQKSDEKKSKKKFSLRGLFKRS